MIGPVYFTKEQLVEAYRYRHQANYEHLRNLSREQLEANALKGYVQAPDGRYVTEHNWKVIQEHTKPSK